jgi:hypothetical protein
MLPAYPVGTNDNPLDPGEIYLWQQSVTKANKCRLLIKDNKKQAYALVFRQCLLELISKIKSSDSFASTLDQDIVQQLLIVRGYCCQFDDHQQGTWALENANHHVSMFY